MQWNTVIESEFVLEYRGLKVGPLAVHLYNSKANEWNLCAGKLLWDEGSSNWCDPVEIQFTASNSSEATTLAEDFLTEAKVVLSKRIDRVLAQIEQAVKAQVGTPVEYADQCWRCKQYRTDIMVSDHHVHLLVVDDKTTDVILNLHDFVDFIEGEN